MRKFLIALIGFLAISVSASADTVFTNFAYPVTKPNGSGTTPSSQTTPVRAGTVANVIDYGADPMGVADSTSAVQAAVNWVSTTSADRGTVYFPLGTYKITSSVSFDGAGSIIFRGEGRGSILSANFAGFVLDRPGIINSGPAIRIIEKLQCVNLSTSAGAGCFRMLGNDVGRISDCAVQAHVGIDIGGLEPSGTSFDTSVNNCSINGLGTEESGSVGVVLGPETSLYDSAVVNFENGIRAHGAGIHIIGGRIEVNKTGIFLGADAAGTAFAVTGCIISPNSMEANNIGVEASVANDCIIGGFSIQGSTNAPAGASAYGIKWDNGSRVTFQSVEIGTDSSGFTSAGFYANPGSTFNGTIISVSSGSSQGPAWSFTASPTYTFIQSNNPTNAFPFASLPTPIEGMEFDITDGTNSLAWGAVATNTGTHTTHYKVRYNGTNWTVMGQ